MSLTFEERNELRQQRSRLLHEKVFAGVPKCAACHGPQTLETPGCKTCWDRKRRRAERERNKKPCRNAGCNNTVVPAYNHRHHRPHSGYCHKCWRQSRSWSNCD